MAGIISIDTPIYVVGFVTDGGTGGFDWGVTRSDMEDNRATLIAEGRSDVTDVRRIALGQLDLNGDFSPDAITDALDERPETWEPRMGEGR